MINKEFIVGSGGIIKDFQDRNIPQNSNNFVSVGVLIPVSEFADLGTYGVCLATSKIVGGVETSLPSLICYSAKTLKIEGVDYIKYQCQLSISYTNFIGQLKLTPYIIEIEILNEGEEDENVVITTQKTFTNTTLNVIRSIASTSDASLEEATAEETLTALIEAKNIKLIEDYKTGTKAQAIVGCFTDYNASSYEGWLLIVKYSGGEIALLPYKNGANNEFTEVDLDGTYYKLSDYSSGTYTSTQLTYTKGEIDTILTNYYLKTETYSDDEVDTLLSAKVDKTTTVNGQPLSSNVLLNKGDVGLGNVENYGIVNSPSADATNKYVDAGGLYTYLITNYADKSDYDTTKAKVDELYTSFKGTSDNDNVVNTLYDLINVFENFPEADNIASILSGLDSRLDTLEAMDNVVVNCGSTTLSSASWVENTDDYASDYPYKITYQNDLLIGATNFDVIFGVDADTSLLSTTALLDNTTGTITFYAVEIPSVDLDIENIVAFTTLNAINTLTTDTINQVAQNKNDITDIKANYELKQESLGTNKGTKTQGISSGFWSQRAKRLNYGETKIEQAYDEIDLSYIDSGDQTTKIVVKQDTGYNEGLIKLQNHTHTLQLDHNGLTLDNKSLNTNRLFTSSTDATESGGVYTLDVSGITGIEVNDYIAYLNSGAFTTLYQVASITSGVATLNVVGSFGGGGSQLYQHNIVCQNDISKHQRFSLTIINDSATPMGKDDVRDFLNTNGYNPSDTTPLLVNNYYKCDGVSAESNVLYIIYGIWYSNYNVFVSVINSSGTGYNVQVNTANDNYYDTVIAL